MLRKKGYLLLFAGIFIAIVLLSFVSPTSKIKENNNNKSDDPKIAASFEGSEQVLITEVNRDANLSGYGLVNIDDNLKIQNKNNNPLLYIFIGIPIDISEDLIFFTALGEDGETISVERSSMVMDKFEMIVVYFDEPLLPGESKSIIFRQSYKDLLTYSWTGSTQQIDFKGYVYPLLPYRGEGDIKAIYQLPESSTITGSDWGTTDPDKFITYDLKDSGFTYIEPMLTNMGTSQNISVVYTDDTVTKLEAIEVTREIHISPWGIIDVKETYILKNTGFGSISSLSMIIPGPTKMVKVSDDMGEILGITLDPEENYTQKKSRTLDIDLSENRAYIIPDSKFKFNIEYHLLFDKFVSIDWFRESIKIDLLTSKYDFLGRDQTIKIFIEGCYELQDITVLPDGIDYFQGNTVLIYESDYVSPLETKDIQITFTVNYFNLILRPFIFILIFIMLSTVIVVRSKIRKTAKAGAIKKEDLPLNEIREFCSLYDEKNALTLEMRQAEDDLKRKKIVKKKYKDILTGNTQKIEEITEELIPFKKALKETNPMFENIIKKMELLEAERISIKDSLNLLETRYKKGKLPSKAAYERLSEDFLDREKKIDRSIDKVVQQLRSYLY